MKNPNLSSSSSIFSISGIIIVIFGLLLMLPFFSAAQPASVPPGGVVSAYFNSVTVTDGVTVNRLSGLSPAITANSPATGLHVIGGSTGIFASSTSGSAGLFQQGALRANLATSTHAVDATGPVRSNVSVTAPSLCMGSECRTTWTAGSCAPDGAIQSINSDGTVTCVDISAIGGNGNNGGNGNPNAGTFELSANPSSQNVEVGSSTSSTLSLNRTSYTETVSFSASASSGVTVNFSPSSTAGNTSTATFTVSSSASTGVRNITITATGSDGTQDTANVTLNITNGSTPSGSFTLSASPGTADVQQGSNVSRTISISRSGGFSENISFNAFNLPAGVTASFSPSSTTGNSSTVTFFANSTATVGTRLITITGFSNSFTRSTTIALTVTASTGTFTISASPSNLSVAAGSSVSSTLSINRVNYSSPVSFSGGSAPGISAQFSGVNASGGTITFTTTSSTTQGTRSLTITGLGNDGQTATTTINLTVTAPAPPPSFTMFRGLAPEAPETGTVNLRRGSVASDFITVTPSGNFSSDVSFSISGLPTGVTAFASPNPASLSNVSARWVNINFSASSSATLGTRNVVVTASGGGTTRTLTIPLNVTN